MRKTLLLPPLAYLLVIPVVVPLILAAAGGWIVALYLKTWPPSGILVILPGVLGLALLAVGLRELAIVLAMYFAYIRHRDRDAAAFALYPGFGPGRETVIGQSHEYVDVAGFVLILFQAVVIVAWAMAARLQESRHRLVYFAVSTLVVAVAFLLFKGVLYAYRWAWSGDARLLLTELPARTGHEFSGEIFSTVGMPAGQPMLVTVRCKHYLRPALTWEADAECFPERRKGGRWVIRFSVPLPFDQPGVTALGVDWQLSVRSTEPGLVPNFFCIFSNLPILRDPDAPAAWADVPADPDEIFDEEVVREADE